MVPTRSPRGTQITQRGDHKNKGVGRRPRSSTSRARIPPRFLDGVELPSSVTAARRSRGTPSRARSKKFGTSQHIVTYTVNCYTGLARRGSFGLNHKWLAVIRKTDQLSLLFPAAAPHAQQYHTIHTINSLNHRLDSELSSDSLH